MSNLVIGIGTRRPSRARSLRTAGIVAGLLVLSLVVTYFLCLRVARYAHPSGSAPSDPVQIDPTNPESGLRYGKGRLHYLGRLALLHTRGSVHDIGAQQGRLLAKDIQRVQRSLQANVEQTVSSEGFFSNRFHDILLRWRWRSLDDGIPGQQLVEIAGMVRGARKSDVGLSYESSVRQTALFDLGTPAKGSAGVDLWSIPRALTAVVPINSPMGNRLIVARNMAMPGAKDGGAAVRQHPVLHINHPQDALPYASLSWPGMIGVVSGINVESLAVFVHFSKTSEVRITREAQPCTLIAREILENASTLPEAISLLKQAKPLGTAIFVVVDGKDGSWAAIERSPSNMEVRSSPSPGVIVDLLESTTMAEDALNDRARRSRPMSIRAQRVAQLTKRNLSQPSEVARILRDRKSIGGATLPLGHRAAIDDPESIQTALFDVSAMVLWVSESSDAAGTFHAIDLRYELNDGVGRAAPPEDIPASTDNPGARDAIRTARQLLIQARLAGHRGKRRHARELAASALSRAPSLPEALLVAGYLAQSDNDDLSARPLLQRFLELGADDLQARDQVEASLAQ